MTAATRLAQEERRLEALQALSLLDTPPEERFDRITRIAGAMFDMPIALASLVDRDRIYYKSRQGLSFAELPRRGSFCDRTISGNSTFVVEDAAADERFRDQELVRCEGGLRFYAGHPLRSRDGHKLGTLCVLDRKPRRFEASQREQLADLARVLETELDRVPSESPAIEVANMRDDLRRFFSLSLDLLCVAGSDGRFVQLNPAWEASLGFSLAELTSRPYIEFVHPEDRDRTLSEARLLENANVTVSFENRYRCKQGGYRHLLWSAVRDRDTGLIYGVARDVTDQRAGEEDLRRAKAHAQTASDAKGRFLTNISQEIRTPLNSVLGFTSVLLEEASGLSARHRSFLERIQLNGRDILFLVNDILDLAKIESGESDLEREAVDLAELIGPVIARLEPQAKQKGLVLRAEFPAGLESLATDPRRLKQVLVNLVGNAVKFTETGQITVRVLADGLSGQPERIEVEDTGIGISYEQQDRIFVAFRQADSPAPRYAGTGLGLTISRSLCEVMGYHLELRSRVGVGTTFTIHLVPQTAAAI